MFEWFGITLLQEHHLGTKQEDIGVAQLLSIALKKDQRF